MKITLIKPSMGDVITGYNINEGSMEPLQLAILAGLIKSPDQTVLYDDRLEKIPYEEPTDLVCITADTFNARRAYQIAGEFRRRGKKVIMGGMHASLLPVEVSLYADCVVIGDAEPVWQEIMDDLKKDCLKKSYQAPFGIPQEGVFPDRSIFKGKKYLPVSLLQFSRGCKYNCSFCSVSRFFHHSHICRKIEDVIYEIEKDKLKTILFVDDNITQNTAALKQLLKELTPLKIKWAGQSGIDMINDRELMQLMADSGCIGHLIGFESIHLNTLKWFNKTANMRNFNNYAETLDILRDFGFMTWASFMIGNDQDTPETIEKTVEFAIKNRFVLSFFHVLMPYPGTKIYEQFRDENRLLYDGKWWNHPDFKYNHATFQPKLMTPEQLTEATIKANKDFYSLSSVTHRLFDAKTNAKNLFNAVVYLRLNQVLRSTSI